MPGCLSKRNPTDGTMHLYIKPRSEAARLFVRRMIPKLGDGHPHVRALLPDGRALPESDAAVQIMMPDGRAVRIAAPVCPACGSAEIIHIRGKTHCARCHMTLETCCD